MDSIVLLCTGASPLDPRRRGEATLYRVQWQRPNRITGQSGISMLSSTVEMEGGQDGQQHFSRAASKHQH
ncbi:hypothetical protein VTN02DRAFT_4322 [Thermoascus thermophilus]